MKGMNLIPRTFWELTTNSKVVIPIIQRDYAQGRQSRKVDEIRINFLETLRAALLDKDKAIELDFIYGSLDTDRQHFVPLDGQQRLTTLFLLHWYLAKKEKKVQHYQNQFLNFNYEVRAASTFFCKKLIEDTGIQMESSTSLSEEIKNQTWFYNDWEYDPTVKGMLVMLDGLHQVFGTEQQQLFDKLIYAANPPISFKYLNLRDYTLTDSLYIKMNARGRGLTAFENFKAKLEQHLEQLSPALQEEFIHKVDGTWLDFFWKIRPADTRVIDSAYLRFFKEIVLFFLAIKKPSTAKYRQLLLDLQVKGKYIPFGQYEIEEVLTQEIIKKVFAILDFYSELDVSSSVGNRLLRQLKEIISPQKISTQKRLLFFASIHYILQAPEQIGTQNHTDWERLLYNLTINTATGMDRLPSAVKAIAQFDRQAVSNVYTYVGHSFEDETKFAAAIPFFDGYQLREEWLKIKLINESRTENQTWEEKILEAEKHSYFEGQIKFLLDWCAYGKQYSVHNFEKYYKKAILIFDREMGIIKDSSFLFLRALFAIAPYQQYDSRRYRSFYQPRQREEWRRLLREQPTQVWIQELLDEMYINQPRKKLQEVVDSFEDKNDWRYAIVKYPELIQNRKRINIEQSSIRLLDVYGLTEYCTTINPFLYTIYKEWQAIASIQAKHILGEEQNDWKSKVELKYKATLFTITNQYDFKQPDSLCFLIEMGGQKRELNSMEEVLDWEKWMKLF